MDRLCCRRRIDVLGRTAIMRLATLHRLLGLSLSVFIVAHFANHVALFWGVEHHLIVQEALRKIYRHPIVEPILIAGFAIQLGLGTRLLLKRGWPRRFWPRLQSASGLILMLFLVQHVGAAFYTRAVWPSIDTNVHWAASVVSQTNSALYFIPYYVLGVTALFIHIAAFVALKKRSQRVAYALCIFGLVFSISLVMALSGAFFEIDLPLPYHSYLTGTIGLCLTGARERLLQ